MSPIPIDFRLDIERLPKERAHNPNVGRRGREMAPMGTMDAANGIVEADVGLRSRQSIYWASFALTYGGAKRKRVALRTEQ